MARMITVEEARTQRYAFVAIPDPTGDGFGIVFPDLPGVSSYAETLADIPSQIADALEVTFDAAEKEGLLVEAPGPYPEGESISWGQEQHPEQDPRFRRITISELATEWEVSRTQLNAKARKLGLGEVVGNQRMVTPTEAEQLKPAWRRSSK